MKGLTLIETMVYLAVLAVFIASAASAGYGLLADTDTNASRLASEDDLQFLSEKVSWALSQAAGAPAAHGLTLSVPVAEPSLDPIVFTYIPDAGAIFMRAGEGDDAQLTASGTVSDASFASDGSVVRVSATVSYAPFALLRSLAI